MKWLVKHMEFLLVGVGSDENVLKSTTVKFAQFQYTKSHWTVSFEWINSIVHEFYLIKQLQKKKKQNKTKLFGMFLLPSCLLLDFPRENSQPCIWLLFNIFILNVSNNKYLCMVLLVLGSAEILGMDNIVRRLTMHFSKHLCSVACNSLGPFGL